MPLIKCPYCGNDAPTKDYGVPAYCPTCGKAPHERKPMFRKRSINNLTPQTIAKMTRISRIGAIVLVAVIVVWYIFARLFYLNFAEEWQAILFSSVLRAGSLSIAVTLAFLVVISWRWRFLGGLLAVAIAAPKVVGDVYSFIYNAIAGELSFGTANDVGWLVGSVLWILVLAFGICILIVGIWQRRQPQFRTDSKWERRISGYSPRKIKIMKRIGRIILTLFWLLSITGWILGFVFDYNRSIQNGFEVSLALTVSRAIYGSLRYVVYIFIAWKWALIGGAIALGSALFGLAGLLAGIGSYVSYYISMPFEWDMLLGWLVVLLELAILFAGGILLIIAGWRKNHPDTALASAQVQSQTILEPAD